MKKCDTMEVLLTGVTLLYTKNKNDYNEVIYLTEIQHTQLTNYRYFSLQGHFHPIHYYKRVFMTRLFLFTCVVFTTEVIFFFRNNNLGKSTY